MILKASGVGKSFQTPAGEISVLSGLDLAVMERETVAVVGESGSGKSTLLSLLAGLDVPTVGGIEVRGRLLGELAQHFLGQLLDALVFHQLSRSSWSITPRIAASTAVYRLRRRARQYFRQRLRSVPTSQFAGSRTVWRLRM